MSDLEKRIRLLAAIYVFEHETEPSRVLLSPDALGMMTEKERDQTAHLLEEQGIINGMQKEQEENRWHYDWRHSFPRITLKGYEYIETDEVLRKEILRLHVQEVIKARAKIANAIEEFAGD